MKSYYNTTHLEGRDLLFEEKNSETQEAKIHVLFYRTPNHLLTASMAHAYFPKSTPLTSIRRGMTNLMNQGIIEKTEITKTGIYGKPEYFYRLIEKTNSATEVETDGQIKMIL